MRPMCRVGTATACPLSRWWKRNWARSASKWTPASFATPAGPLPTEQVARQSADFQRLGILGDWANPYLTMDFRVEADIVRSLARIIANGHLYRGSKPVYWCIDCGSALAEAEVEYEDRDSPAIDVRFPVADPEALLVRLHHVEGHGGQGPLSVVIWTTTPWTLPANQAVALNPGLEYLVVQVETDRGQERLLVAEAAAERFAGPLAGRALSGPRAWFGLRSGRAGAAPSVL
jgi:isoleucyl-tRNA synthetase